MKIYYCGSIRGGRQDGDIYRDHIKKLQNYGEVLTEHVGCTEKDEDHGHFEIHDQDVAWLEESDVIVAEVTQPSLGVGYEIGRAIAMGKPILCLFRPDTGKKLSCMIRGISPDASTTVDYKLEEVDGIFKDFFAKLQLKSKEKQSHN